MRQLDVHDVELDGVLIPDAMDAGFVLEAFEPDIAVGEGRFAGFDEDLGAGAGITQHDEDGWRRMFVHLRRIVRRDVDVEDADPFIGEDLVMEGLVADLDLGTGCEGQEEAGEKEDRLAHKIKRISNPRRKIEQNGTITVQEAAS